MAKVNQNAGVRHNCNGALIEAIKDNTQQTANTFAGANFER